MGGKVKINWLFLINKKEGMLLLEIFSFQSISIFGDLVLAPGHMRFSYDLIHIYAQLLLSSLLSLLLFNISFVFFFLSGLLSQGQSIS